MEAIKLKTVDDLRSRRSSWICGKCFDRSLVHLNHAPGHLAEPCPGRHAQRVGVPAMFAQTNRASY